jgi:Rrf2 family protein
LRALVDGHKKTLSAICEEEAVPQQFGYKILKKLAGAGYVHIKRGKEGGYTISDSFPDKTLYDLTIVMDNPTDISPCVIPGYICEAHREKGEVCNVNLRLSALQASINNDLQGVNLRDLVAEHRHTNQSSQNK